MLKTITEIPKKSTFSDRVVSTVPGHHRMKVVDSESIRSLPGDAKMWELQAKYGIRHNALTICSTMLQLHVLLKKSFQGFPNTK